MAISPRLELRQSQTLVMTPQLQQAIKLLQFSNLELRDYVDQELERNPLLERTEPEGGESEPPAEPPAAPEPQLEQLTLDPDAPASRAAEEATDTDYDNIYNNDSASDAAEAYGSGDSIYPERGGSGGFDEDLPSLEGTLATSASLKDHLEEQMKIAITDPAERLVASVLIDGLDEAGYLTIDTAELAEQAGVDHSVIEALIRRLQRFDPTGVFARDLRECLALQLRERDRLDPAMERMLDNLPLVARRDIAALMRVCGVDAEDIADMIGELKALNPKPGNAFDPVVAQTLIPDVFVRRGTAGWVVELNADTLPRLLVNMRYHATVQHRARGKADKVFLSDCLASANWLIRSLDQRANTILKVATELVKRQEGFLEHGVKQLKPLNLRTIAEAIEMHESTVSRVTSNKYIATPRGIFEMKYFFTAALDATDGGEKHSAEAVRAQIRELILAESAEDILSDDKICELLKEEGVDIARRTVAKYREAMRIGSSAERRRAKRLEKQISQ